MNEVKKYHTIKVEGVAPIELTYKILADDEHEAMEIFDKGRVAPSQIKPKPGFTKKKSAKVYKYGTTTILLQKNY